MHKYSQVISFCQTSQATSSFLDSFWGLALSTRSNRLLPAIYLWLSPSTKGTQPPYQSDPPNTTLNITQLRSWCFPCSYHLLWRVPSAYWDMSLASDTSAPMPAATPSNHLLWSYLSILPKPPVQPSEKSIYHQAKCTPSYNYSAV